MNRRAWVIVFLASLCLTIAGAVIGSILEARGALTAADLGPEGVAAVKIGFLALFCVLGFSIVPLLLGTFVAGQIRIGNGDQAVIKWLQAHERAVVYGIWILFLLGLCLGLPTAIKDGVFQ